MKNGPIVINATASLNGMLSGMQYKTTANLPFNEAVALGLMTKEQAESLKIKANKMSHIKFYSRK